MFRLLARKGSHFIHTAQYHEWGTTQAQRKMTEDTHIHSRNNVGNRGHHLHAYARKKHETATHERTLIRSDFPRSPSWVLPDLSKIGPGGPSRIHGLSPHSSEKGFTLTSITAQYHELGTTHAQQRMTGALTNPY